MTMPPDNWILDDDLGGQLERRYLHLTHQMLEQIAPVALTIEQTDAAPTLALLDEQLPNIGGLF